MRINRWIVSLCFFINFAAAIAGPAKGLTGMPECSSTNFIVFNGGSQANYKTDQQPPNSRQTNISIFNDSLPKTRDVTVMIPFEYKQSSLNFQSTFRSIDSVVEVLFEDTSITLSIDGFSYFDEGSDSICYWLSFNRALAVRDYVVGRGIDSLRILSSKGRGSHRSIQRKVLKQPVEFNCTAEITIKYPIPPPPDQVQDLDDDGIPDTEDSCRSEYGYKVTNGCPDRNAIIVPFEMQQSSLFSTTYKVLDSVIVILRNNPSLTIAIEGHAYKKEGIETVCERLARERADIVKRYLLTRRIGYSRIESVKSLSNLRPLNAGRNPWEIARNSRAEVFFVQH